ncbi:MAG: sterol-binding protein [Gammaproteobacteria bacterium]|nr:MAG: sterol-binding protein [Gammaproteobacteria bacterium]RTZ74437.1 MAG: sterol-binding protein [Gammaproteobacteria bacterium]
MSTRDLALASLEKAINAVLALDPLARKRLARHHGKIIGIHLRGPEITLYFIPDEKGGLQLQGSIEGEPDALLSGSPLDLIRSGDKESGSGQLFSGRVMITGDTALAHDFGATLAGLEIDWEEQLSKFTGDLIAHEAGNLARQTLAYAEQTGERLARDLGEYLTEEARLLPHPNEVEEFVAEVDRLRDDTERLEARINRLERQLAARKEAE